MEKSTAHRQLEALKWRMPLAREQLYYLDNLQRGYEGEREFKKFVDSYIGEGAVTITDFTFSVDGTVRQIDAFIVFNDAIIIFEVKNYQGDYLFKNGEFYNTKYRDKIKSPIDQLDNTVILLKRLFKRIDIHIPIKSYVVFIGEDFHLYEAPRNINIVMRSQLPNFLNELRLTYRHADENTIEFINTLNEFMHLEERRLHIDYSYDSLKKSIFCNDDGGELVLNNRTYYECPKCYKKTSIEDVVLQAIFDFHTLFPEKKLTISSLYNFTGGKISKYHYRKLLKKNFKRLGNGRSVHYTVDKEIE